MWGKILVFICWLHCFCEPLMVSSPVCGERKNVGHHPMKRLKYVFGDALLDSEDCLGPDGVPYPRDEISRLVEQMEPSLQNKLFSRSMREGRSHFEGADDEAEEQNRKVRITAKTLLDATTRPDEVPSFSEALEMQQRLWKRDASEERKISGKNKQNKNSNTRRTSSTKNNPREKPALPAVPAKKKSGASVRTQQKGDSGEKSKGSDAAGQMPSQSPPNQCSPDHRTPARLCKTTYNTTAPMYGVSLTSGQPVTIVQKFPDLLQQVVYETCDQKECDVLHGECTQTYIPYLFLVIPLGPVTLTGQDYVLVESGCACRPKYAQEEDPNPVSIIPNF